MNFGSDNWAGAAPEILAALTRANAGAVPSYGGDELTRRVEARFAEMFEKDCAVFFVATGGAANGLALAAMTPPYGVVLCHQDSHVQADECGGPEFFTGGAKLLPIAGPAGKLRPDAIRNTSAGLPQRPPHGAPVHVLSLTQGTEYGTIYSVDELAALCAAAHEAGLLVHVDGARFSNAVAASGASPAELSWKAGVDVLCFGGTKNGCLAAEAVIFFNKDKAADFAYRRKRAGHLFSKMRFIAAQFDAYLENGLWLKLAAHANAMAQKLSAGLAAIPGVKIAYPTEFNELFPVFPAGVAQQLLAAGAVFYPWVTHADPAERGIYRMVTSFATTEDEVSTFLEIARRAVD